MKRKSNKRSSKRRTNVRSNPSPAVIVYRGPMLLPKSSAADSVTIRMTSVTAVTASAGGVVSFQILNIPSSFADFSTYSGLYVECRVLALEGQYMPHYLGFGGATTVNSQAMVGYVDRNSGTAPFSSLANGWNFQDSKIGNTSKSMTLTWRMASTIEAQFTNVTAPISTGSLNLTAVGLTASQTCGVVFATLLVQFRNRD
jgi:hypothetical protein